MNDHDAIDQITAALDKWFKGEASEVDTLRRIATITGENATAHTEAKEDHP